MFVHTTVLKVKPENVPAVVDLLTNEKMMAILRSTQGLHHAYVLESTEEPGKVTSQTFWDSMADARNGFSSPAYTALLGDLRPILIVAPERFSYNLLQDVILK
jgi:heme-degrading monooxygenase HmoA